ncbi:DUF2752 domain-containing protein [Streptomyces sp. NPDC003038]|uniref:DUF2752 domain-containing protein n=1 Tax=unclassified Streptomyces TaxID=2593676 RepID=UPI0033A08A44
MTGENQRVDASRTPDVVPPTAREQPEGRDRPERSEGPDRPPWPQQAGPARAPASAVRRSRARRLAAPALTLAAAASAFAYVGTVDPNEPGHYPVCPLLSLTRILCPGCGGLRSAHAFAHGDLATAFGANALAVAGYFVFAVFMVLWLVRAFRGGPPPRLALKPLYWWGIGAVALVFVVIRNLPFGSALAP